MSNRSGDDSLFPLTIFMLVIVMVGGSLVRVLFPTRLPLVEEVQVQWSWLDKNQVSIEIEVVQGTQFQMEFGEWKGARVTCYQVCFLAESVNVQILQGGTVLDLSSQSNRLLQGEFFARTNGDGNLQITSPSQERILILIEKIK